MQVWFAGVMTMPNFCDGGSQWAIHLRGGPNPN